MMICAESTEKIVTVNGVQARIWEGETESGIPVILLVTRIAVIEGVDQEQFKRELQECRPPSAAAEAMSLRMIL